MTEVEGLLPSKMSGMTDVPGEIGISQRFAVLNRLIMRDMNNNRNSNALSLYTRDNIQTYLKNPANYQKQLREAVVYIYGASSHFRRLIQYFVSLSDLSYVVSPYRIDPKTTNPKSISRNYRKVLNTMSAMEVRSQFSKILTVCLREDVFYGTIRETTDNITIQQLPSDYCAISAIEGNVLNVTFDFSYFDTNSHLLPYYPDEFSAKYDLYRKDTQNARWQELVSPTSFAIKCNNDILEYSMPPFAGVLREVYDLEDYRQLKLSKTAIENYAMLVMTLPMDDDGNWILDLDKAKDFWRNLDGVLPEEIGSVLSPMKIDKIGFEKNHTADTNTVAEAEQNLFSAAGVSSLLFNNDKASANALILSIKADQAITYGVVKSIEDAVNRFIWSKPYGKNFKVTFLDVSPFNRKEAGDAYLKACQFGVPMISYYASSQGLNQSELDCMSFLETEVLGLAEMFKPLASSATMSGTGGNGATDGGGAPEKDASELSESGERHREEA